MVTHTFMFLGSSLLAVSGPTCNHFAGPSAGKEKELSKWGRVGSLPQLAAACTRAWACDVVRPLCASLCRPPQLCTDRPGHTPRGAHWRLELFLGPLKGGASWLVCSQCHPGGGGSVGWGGQGGRRSQVCWSASNKCAVGSVISCAPSFCREGPPSGF